MKLFYFLLVITTILTVVTGILVFIGYKIYPNKVLFFIIPIIGYFPLIGIIFGHFYKSRALEVFIGHFLFYYNYIILVSIFLLITYLLGRTLNKDLFVFLSNNQKKFYLFLLLFFTSLSIVGRHNFKTLKKEYFKISLNKKTSNSTLRLGFISDVHLNNIFNGDSLNKALKKMANDKVEIVLIGGDFVDNDPHRINDNIKEIISKYKFPKGIYAVLGNHEYYGGIDRSIDFIKESGIKLLRDEVLTINGLNIIGRDDKTNSNRKKLSSLLDGIEKFPLIVLDHNPISIKESLENNVNLHLSGHTHNGQLFPLNHLVDHLNLNGYGHKKIGTTHTIVSSGLGTWMIPYRIKSKTEYMIIDIDYFYNPKPTKS
ncbi:MAG: metallophosphoesterase [Psychrilyobacter sp.]|uniref:metallophosphoesterase n=1 Tax=Psychrilyobacter sp. TaxID=2586924 RepID=UPI003C747D70